MRVKSAKRYRKPAYPERELYALRPDLLGASILSRWMKSKAVMSALIAFILSGTKADCLANQADTAPISDKTEIQDKEKAPEPLTQEAEVKIAPIFIHGDGAGSTGCIAISAPVFLPETEAVEIIFNELKKARLDFDKRDIALPDCYIEGVNEKKVERKE
ncbi:MAG: hypothetical protein A2Y62_19835 [Candidatus Fischerbacteria bacterium RBG_13_37_8]|uniref:Uncharacterized protein n=1 Tax=Candidatus Fischerbacteria bacterium RBG_13_37_8 TaxID=1817863 RepID=A0A1F5VM88_9BACT|nr:MAG: hypothetical protein A2Y62_19835 [Candidatus Fischerbacteria bacterium RBG_13_37_8]